MTIIYAAIPDAVIWSDNKRVHKAGKVPLHEPLTVIRQYSQNWFKIERPTNITLDVDPIYPNYWVYRTQIINELPGESDPTPTPTPDSELISDLDAAYSIITLLNWWRQGM